MPVFLATQAAEIRRILVQKPAWENSLWESISKKPNTKEGWWNNLSDRAPA
jgi:hypothetical protein